MKIPKVFEKVPTSNCD
ncbi:unnamed protein product [Acanthoscelides obtectus]|uniref:Uncharacterized protein n=1 Tax=Acanthoscelides obtectus TaxID=200917 RepID=A0A9P0JH14_ACAOB|nr:unnamed protein product [Acanthoscelides obtectus]CAK1639804.1 hypothetical protein AOBTE_LOCUS11384 [Acanthoscelides obtectus]